MRGIFDYIAPLYSRLEDTLLSGSREKVLKHIDPEPGNRILDVGGGTGSLLQDIDQLDVELFLLDESKGMVKQSPETNQIILGKACWNPFKNNSFDYVLCIDALHHFENKIRSVKEMMRTVKSGGTIIILEFDRKHLVTKFIKYGERLVGEPSRFFEPEDMKKYFNKNGFKTEIEKIKSYEYILQAKKLP